MFVSNKLDSDKLIKELKLNYSPFEVVYSFQEATKFINAIDEPIGIREKRQGGGQLIVNLTWPEALDILKSGKIAYPLSVYHDMRETETHLIYQGEVWLFPDGSLKATYNHTPEIKNREACSSHPARIHVNIDMSDPLNRKWGWDYYPLRAIIDYCCEYGLIGPVVEFSYYSIPVGWKHEKIVIWEVRNY
ncbi:MAG: hypothetical protein Q7R33_04245 [Nitrosarchaeum sp.]|nr:hypothetical protein [Nitrosarchaeum sp.]